MPVNINLCSQKSGEIKNFLECFYGKKVKMDEDIDQWICVYNKPLEAVDIISAIMDNKDKYEIKTYIQMVDGDLHPVTSENHNDIIKDMFNLFYDEVPRAT